MTAEGLGLPLVLLSMCLAIRKQQGDGLGLPLLLTGVVAVHLATAGQEQQRISNGVGLLGVGENKEIGERGNWSPPKKAAVAAAVSDCQSAVFSSSAAVAVN